ncbi:MAG TPA: nuclear transport factor 2 family protein [Pyrinomonadaceae bacterium]|jgi:hypothetical protein
MLKKVLVLVLLIMSALSVTLAQSSEKAIEEIKKMDRQWQVESYSSRDLKDYDRIVAEDFLITGSNGKILTKSEKRANVKADYTEFSPDAVFKIDETSHKVRILDDDVAVSTGYIIEKYVYQGNKIDARVYFTCTYLKRKGVWQVAAAHYTRIKQQ